jgi:hypothetical protein
MDINDVQKIANKLKELHLMDFSREIIPGKRRNCTFSAHISSEKILFDPNTLIFLQEIEVLWMLLHEEGHLIFQQNGKKRESLIYKLWFVAAVVSVSLTTLLFILASIPISPLFYVIITLLFLSIITAICYINRTYFGSVEFLNNNQNIG